MGKTLHVGCPNIPNRERLLERINDLLDRRWLTNNGPYVQEFERSVAGILGVKHCIATCNGTIALEILAKALDLQGEVIVPAFTFVATAHALTWLGIKPVFCDIDPSTHNIDLGKIEAKISPQTTGIMGVHIWGRPCEVVKLTSIANQYDLKLIFDAAHAFGCSYKGRMVGNFGSGEVFSFHATKFLNTFEGGAITTNDSDLAARCRLMRNFGFGGEDKVVSLGINGKMSEISAAMGLTGLESLEDFISINYRNYKQYQEELSGTRGLELIYYQEDERRNYQYIVLEIEEDIVGVSRDELVKILQANGILARRYFYPGCHRMEPYRADYQRLDATEELCKKVLALPTGSTVSEAEIRRICEIIKSVKERR